MYGNTQQNIEIWRLVWCLVSLLKSKVILKIISLHALNPRAKSGRAAVVSLLFLYCCTVCVCWFFLNGYTSCFFPCCLEILFLLLWVVGRKHNCCLSFLAVNINPGLELHHPSYSVWGPCNSLGCTWPPGGARPTCSLKPCLCQLPQVHPCTVEHAAAQPS